MTDPIAPIRAEVAGRYEILEEIGHGAFATVYLARDLRHDREVAFKVLNANPSSETGELRFLREIRLLAKLQHPNILPLIDSGHAEALLYYVMPYVKGETLRQRISRERHLPIDFAVSVIREASDALACAHAQGIVHRDIKPENILLSGSHAVIADFGIARAIDLAGVRQLTVTGAGSPGTPAYMSPEQLLSDTEIDASTDIYSLGCVFYEMLTGLLAFGGRDDFVKRFTEPPPLASAKRADVSASLDAIVTRAMARDPKQRYRAAELVAALARADLGGRGGDRRRPLAVLGRRIKSSARPIAMFGTFALLVAIVLAWPAKRIPVTAAPLRRLDILLPDSAPLAFVGAASLGIGSRSLALSPDGNRMVYAARHSGTIELFAREFDKLGATRLAGTDNAYMPFFSPDGRWLGFFADGYLKKTSMTNGQVVTLARVNVPMGGIWTSEDRIIVADKAGSVPSTISAAGGSLAPISFKNPLLHLWRFPQLLPDGKWVIHTDIDGALMLSSLESGRGYGITRTGVTRRDSTDASGLIFGTCPFYVSTGHIIYLAGGGVLMALPFDARRRVVLGPPVPVLDGIRQEAEAGAGQFAVADDGSLVYAPGVDAGRSVLVSVDDAGKPDTLRFPAAVYHGFELSPDGQRIIIGVLSQSGRPELWVLDISKGSQTRIRTEGIPLDIPRWWPDGKRIVVAEFEAEGGLSLSPFFRQSLDAVSDRDTLIAAALSVVPAPDGKHIAVTGRKNYPGLWLLPTDGVNDKPLRLTPENVYFTSFSPDGKWVVYTAFDSPEIYASSVERPGERYKISSSGGEEPLWSPRGDRVVYRNGEQWFSVDISTANGFSASEPRLMFEGPYLNVPGWSHSFFPDGRRQLLLLGPQEQTSLRLVAINNWFSELMRLAPLNAKNN